MTTFDVPPHHPSFDGHFPGHPILPGVVMLAEAMAAVENATGTTARDWILEQAKFVRAVEPGARLAITHAMQPSGNLRFEIRDGDRVVASGAMARRAR